MAREPGGQGVIPFRKLLHILMCLGQPLIRKICFRYVGPAPECFQRIPERARLDHGLNDASPFKETLHKPHGNRAKITEVALGFVVYTPRGFQTMLISNASA